MADFGFFSDTDEELSEAVEELISQAKDLCVLEQVSKINCAGFTDSELPSDLEIRFRKLKCFPVSKPRNPIGFKSSTKSLKAQKRGDDGSNNYSVSGEEEEENPDGKGWNFMGDEQKPDTKLELEKKLGSGSEDSSRREEEQNGPKQSGLVSSPSDSSDSWVDKVASFSSSNQKKSKPKLEAKSRSEGSSFGSEDLSMDAPSPPRKSGCFWFSPKKVSRKKSKGRGSVDKGNIGDDMLLSDLGTFSVKAQENILKKSMKEEAKIAREAEKIVKWAMHASARMSFDGVEDQPSDDEGNNLV